LSENSCPEDIASAKGFPEDRGSKTIRDMREMYLSTCWSEQRIQMADCWKQIVVECDLFLYELWMMISREGFLVSEMTFPENPKVLV
jgi:hypothetical protein